MIQPPSRTDDRSSGSATPFTDVIAGGELVVLRYLRDRIDEQPIDRRPVFHDLMTAAFEHCGLQTRLIADDMGFSISSVRRWVEGRVAPHPSLWPRIRSWVIEHLEARIEMMAADIHRKELEIAVLTEVSTVGSFTPR